MESLEQRRYMSFVYENYEPGTGLQEPRFFSGSHNGSIVVIGDIDGDGVRDVLEGGFSDGDPLSTRFDVFSGATGILARSHMAPEGEYGSTAFGLGDVDGDGMDDYGIATGNGLFEFQGGVTVYSGVSGNMIRRIEGAINAAAAGDVNGDGRADVAGVDSDRQAVTIYSGADGAALRVINAVDHGSPVGFGVALGGGRDLNLDQIPDLVVTSVEENGTGGSRPALWAFSGTNGELLWSQAFGEFRAGPVNHPTLTPDLTGDGAADVAITHGEQIGLLSGASGAVARMFTIAGEAFGSTVGLAHDLDGDLLPDFVLAGQEAGPEAKLIVVSSADGELLHVLRPPPPENLGEAGARFLDRLAVADMDGDGRTELLTGFGTAGAGFTSNRTYLYDGDGLTPPTYSGVTSGSVSRSIVWGMAGNDAFISRDGVVTVMEDLPEFNADEAIVDVFESGDRLIILACGLNGMNPFAWISDHTLSNVERLQIGAFMQLNAPPGAFTQTRGIGVTDGFALVQMVLNGRTAITWLADLEAETLTFLFEGAAVGIGLDPARGPVVIGRHPMEENAGKLWREGATTDLAFRPVAISDSGRFIVGLQPSPADPPPLNLVVVDIAADPQLITFPLLPGGTDFMPVGVNDSGDVVGTYVTNTEQTSAFLYRQSVGQTVDVRTDDVFGDPDSFATTSIDGLAGISNAGDLLIRQGATNALLSVVDGATGPIRAADGSVINIAFTPAGAVYVVTINEAGELLYLARAGAWSANEVPGASFATPPFAGPTVTWYDEGDDRPNIAIAGPDGLFLLDANAAGWTARNLTAEINGAEAVVSALVTLLPHSGLRLLAGLTADGELVLYGETVELMADGNKVWAYDNLYQSVLEPNDIPAPELGALDGTLTAYVTSWGGQNIAGVNAQGKPVVFWTAPGIVGWRMTDLTQNLMEEGLPAEGLYFRSVHVTLTSWDGINLYGETGAGGEIQAIWWVPQFGGSWRADSIAQPQVAVAGGASTLTAWATPWDGLNVARLTQGGEIEVYWWSPESNRWARTVLNDDAGAPANLRLEGRLFSNVSPNGEFSVIGRNSIGDMFRFYWRPSEPWQVERV